MEEPQTEEKKMIEEINAESFGCTQALEKKESVKEQIKEEEQPESPVKTDEVFENNEIEELK